MTAGLPVGTSGLSAGLRLAPIDPARYSAYRRRVIFECFKWDPQVGDVNTISDHVLVLSRPVADQLVRWTEQLAAETLELESELRRNPRLLRDLCLPEPIVRLVRRGVPDPEWPGLRLMRFDFHPTASGWSVSEVNSDVPGGFAEASVLPELAAEFVSGAEPCGHLLQSLVHALKTATASREGAVALVHATSYADDRQVMQALADRLAREGLRSVFAAPDHIVWKNGEALCVAEETPLPVSALVRFFPAEWLTLLPRSSNWSRYFLNPAVPMCNHGTAFLTQTKRLPLVWDKSGCPMSTWRALLPETIHPPRFSRPSGWILKPALGRVGQGIAIPEATTPAERWRIALEAALRPRDWVAQRRFESRPLATAAGERHLCIGSFAVGGKACGFYGRIGTRPRIDGQAQDIPVLVERAESKGEISR